LGGAAAGGAAFGGAPLGASLGASFLGLPSGPSSSFGAACAITGGATCAGDGELANCIAVRAVVASSTRRSFVMMISVPGKAMATKAKATKTMATKTMATKRIVQPNLSASRSTVSH
jgi:hypothetical protein